MVRACTVAAGVLLGEVHGAGQPAPSLARPVIATESVFVRLPELEGRLAALSPERPEEYFLLGEEVAAESASAADARLASTLLVLAYELDRARGSGNLRASACLALADLSRRDADRRWLKALAQSIDRRYGGVDLSGAVREEVADETAFLAATALGNIRAGEGLAARELLTNPDVRAVVERYEELLSDIALPGALGVLDRQASDWPCPECRNRRFVRKRDMPTETTLCYVCAGDPGPRLTPSERLAHLRFESFLLKGIHRSWGAELAVDHGAALIDPDPEKVAEHFGVDPTLTLWRGGTWVAPEGSVGSTPGSGGHDALDSASDPESSVQTPQGEP